ncbi:MAG TPA: F0F1 ATP synthase subunit B, partial [Croceibacterium sp.]
MLEYLAAAAGETGAHTEVAGGAEHHAEAAAFGVSLLTPGFFVALAMLVVFAIMLKARVPALIAGALDARITAIRTQLDEAARLRAEAEALRDEYAKKASQADVE